MKISANSGNILTKQLKEKISIFCFFWKKIEIFWIYFYIWNFFRYRKNVCLWNEIPIDFYHVNARNWSFWVMSVEILAKISSECNVLRPRVWPYVIIKIIKMLRIYIQYTLNWASPHPCRKRSKTLLFR